MNYSRRNFIEKTTKAVGLLSLAPTLTPFASTAFTTKTTEAGAAKPVSVYVNWAAYDELSDNVFLDEEIAMKQFNEMLRLREEGVQFDYYLMDAFWFDKDGGYREWRKESWPDGGKNWMKACFDNNIKPGLWISTNLMQAGGDNYEFLRPIPKWEDSVGRNNRAFSLFEGGYLEDLISALKYHADQGISMFKFDFADFNAVTEKNAGRMTQDEIVKANKSAFISAMKDFRKDYPDVLLMAYNGFGGVMGNTYTPFREVIDLEWLNVFDSMYCGDPRAADVPCMNFWRSKDIYSDHMVRQFAFNDIPLKRIDNSAFMIGTTGTCYYRGSQAWKGMLLLSLARAGWINTYYGNLDLLSEEDGKWFAKAQSMYYPLQGKNNIRLLGGIPGDEEWYGYRAFQENGDLILLVNPKQKTEEIDLSFIDQNEKGRILFHDAGFIPDVKNSSVKLGPEQMALIGFGSYNNPQYDLGVGGFIEIPSVIQPIAADWQTSSQLIRTELKAPAAKDIRFVVQQYGADGFPVRSSGGSPPNGIPLDEFLILKASQDDKELPIEIQYDKAIWSGLSWAVGEIRNADIDRSKPLLLQAVSAEQQPVTLRGEL
ncbi:MAG: hypothetical protein ACQEQ0_12505, partial [Bacteroidota bacterium]